MSNCMELLLSYFQRLWIWSAFPIYNDFQEGDFQLDSRHLILLSPPSGKFILEIITEICPQKNTSLEVTIFFCYFPWFFKYIFRQKTCLWSTNYFLVCLFVSSLTLKYGYSFAAGAVPVIWEFLYTMWSRGFPENYILSGSLFEVIIDVWWIFVIALVWHISFSIRTVLILWQNILVVLKLISYCIQFCCLMEISLNKET